MAVNEGLVLNGTDINDGTNYSIRSIDFTPPKKRQEWIQGADADGSALVRDPLFENRTITIRLRVQAQSTMDIALGTKVGALVDLLEECEKQGDGLPLVWTPATGTKSLTFYVLSGEVTALPVDKTSDNSGYFRKSPMVELRLDCKPFGYGALVSNAATVTADTNPVQTLTIASVTGDVPAEARLVVTDAATQSRRHVEWGLQQRYYDAATSLLIDSASLVTSGFSGSATTRTGAFSASGVIRASLFSQVSAVCGTGNLANIGSYRIKARVYAVAGILPSNISCRLSWRDGDGPMRSNDWVQPLVNNNFVEVDLGLITIAEKTLGTQRWTGQIDAYSTNPGDTLDVDYIVLVPTEGYGKGRAAATSYTPGTINARDEFTGIAASTALNARTAPAGGVWTTSGSTTDFVASDNGFSSGSEEESRAATNDTGAGRFAILGSTNYTDTELATQVRWGATGILGGSPVARTGIVARWVDASNYLLLRSSTGITGQPAGLELVSVVAGVSTTLSSSTAVNYSVLTTYRYRLIVYASGLAIASVLDANDAVLSTITAASSVLATGGVLATGKPGFWDLNTTATSGTRFFDNFSHSAPASEPIVVYSGRAAEIRFDSAIRQDSTGTYYGVMPLYRGGRFLLPPAGSAARTSRILVKARRNDIDTGPDDQIADSTTVTVHYTPRYVVIPR